MHLQRSKSTVDGLKSFFIVFWRKPSLGAPEAYRSVINEERWQCENSKVNERDAIIAMSRPWNTEGQVVSFHTKSSLELLIIKKQLQHIK